jgi:DNA-directed RNA polymerase subunit F
MSDIEIIKETPVSLTELKEKFEALPKKKEPAMRAKKMEDYLTHFAKYKSKEVREIKEKIKQLNLIRLNERCIGKVLDLHPEDIESLRMILTSENITVKPEDITRILECLK